MIRAATHSTASISSNPGQRRVRAVEAFEDSGPGQPLPQLLFRGRHNLTPVNTVSLTYDGQCQCHYCTTMRTIGLHRQRCSGRARHTFLSCKCSRHEHVVPVEDATKPLACQPQIYPRYMPCLMVSTRKVIAAIPASDALPLCAKRLSTGHRQHGSPRLGC
jgi:hypothetical protein